jgi:hypothetical protein
MSARDFINETLLPKLERELADEARGNKHYLAGFEGALKAMTQFIESKRDEWSARANLVQGTWHLRRRLGVIAEHVPKVTLRRETF